MVPDPLPFEKAEPALLVAGAPLVVDVPLVEPDPFVGDADAGVLDVGAGVLGVDALQGHGECDYRSQISSALQAISRCHRWIRSIT